MIEEVVDGDPLLEIIVAPMAPSAQAPVFREFHVPQPEAMAVGIAELVYDRRRAPVIPEVELERPHLVLVRIHLTSFPAPNRYGFLSASPFGAIYIGINTRPSCGTRRSRLRGGAILLPFRCRRCRPPIACCGLRRRTSCPRGSRAGRPSRPPSRVCASCSPPSPAASACA